jgi:hypothetical protein
VAGSIDFGVAVGEEHLVRPPFTRSLVVVLALSLVTAAGCGARFPRDASTSVGAARTGDTSVTGDEGAALTDAGRAWLRASGAPRPDRIVAAPLPGFDDNA